MQTFESAIYKGKVFHHRFEPKQHEFTYSLYMWWLKLDELVAIEKEIKHFHLKKSYRYPVSFSSSDYLKKDEDCSTPLKERALNCMNKLTDERLEGDIFFFGQVRTFNLYFSPVNFWFLRDHNGEYTHMLAEVSNTPWNERHHYLVDLQNQQDTEKAFHVSPFNPMDMIYKWQIQMPGQQINLRLSCFKQNKHFEAAIAMQRSELSNKTLKQCVSSIPSMTVKTMAGIYWQALKLFFKRVPVYTHS
ncbi:DUF1365 domain-containing protein [Glaciecola sp. 1036]|uniref:DUF1365 domain-containing protein n=1 Tax=Alteromonadaceae TaxID=72275 RepID=UPI003D0321A1